MFVLNDSTMTQIDFFSNAPDRVDYAVRLLRKVQQAGQTAVVYGDASILTRLSEALWAAAGFLAHDLLIEPKTTDNDGDSDDFCAPFILLSYPREQFPHHEVLVNLSDEQPEFFAQFERLIEVVPDAPEPKQKARERWQQYKHCGYALKHHDIAAKRQKT